jgi:hypothetical protein
MNGEIEWLDCRILKRLLFLNLLFVNTGKNACSKGKTFNFLRV